MEWVLTDQFGLDFDMEHALYMELSVSSQLILANKPLRIGTSFP